MYYTERQTRIVYEARFFDGFVFVKPLGSREFPAERLDMNEFISRFDLYAGDPTAFEEVLPELQPEG